MAPYLLWSFFSFMRKGDYSLHAISSIALYPDKYFWFLWAMFFINVLFNMTQLLANKLHRNETVCLMATGIVLMAVIIQQ